MTVRERLERAETMLMMARSACGNDGAQIFSTPRALREAVDRVLVEIIDDVYWARRSLTEQVLNQPALTDDERDERERRRATQRA